MRQRRFHVQPKALSVFDKTMPRFFELPNVAFFELWASSTHDSSVYLHDGPTKFLISHGPNHRIKQLVQGFSAVSIEMRAGHGSVYCLIGGPSADPLDYTPAQVVLQDDYEKSLSLSDLIKREVQKYAAPYQEDDDDDPDGLEFDDESDDLDARISAAEQLDIEAEQLSEDQDVDGEPSPSEVPETPPQESEEPPTQAS